MAKYDQGGGCPCGLNRVCDCANSLGNNEIVVPPKKKKGEPFYD